MVALLQEPEQLDVTTGPSEPLRMRHPARASPGVTSNVGPAKTEIESVGEEAVSEAGVRVAPAVNPPVREPWYVFTSQTRTYFTYLLRLYRCPPIETFAICQRSFRGEKPSPGKY